MPCVGVARFFAHVCTPAPCSARLARTAALISKLRASNGPAPQDLPAGTRLQLLCLGGGGLRKRSRLQRATRASRMPDHPDVPQ